MSTRPSLVGCGGIAQLMHLPHLLERPDLFDVRFVADSKQGGSTRSPSSTGKVK